MSAGRATAALQRWALDTADEGFEVERGFEGSEHAARRWAQRKADELGGSLYLWPEGKPGVRGIEIDPRSAR